MMFIRSWILHESTPLIVTVLMVAKCMGNNAINGFLDCFSISFVLCNTISKTLYQVIYYLLGQDGAVGKFGVMA